TQSVVIRLRPGVAEASGLADVRRIATSADNVFARLPQSSGCVGDGFAVLGVQRPAEITNYRTMGSTPALLGATLAVAALAALGITLIASVRRRRRDLAILKALGFGGRQL